MQENLKQFIERNIELIENSNYEKLYEKARHQIPFQIGNLTYNLVLAGIDVLKHTDIIYTDMFSNSMIDKIDIPENIKYIRATAFQDCFNLTEVTLPKSLKYLDEFAFQGCYELNTVNYRGTVEEWYESNFNTQSIFIDADTASINCSDGVVRI